MKTKRQLCKIIGVTEQQAVFDGIPAGIDAMEFLLVCMEGMIN